MNKLFFFFKSSVLEKKRLAQSMALVFHAKVNRKKKIGIHQMLQKTYEYKSSLYVHSFHMCIICAPFKRGRKSNFYFLEAEKTDFRGINR